MAATPPVIWIASYPKSGNTWVRFLIANLVHGPVDRSALIESLIPDVHKPGPRDPLYLVNGRVLCKTHWVRERAARQATAAAIYVVRHPLDVLASHFNYLGLGAGSDERERFAERFIAEGGAPGWRDFGFGTWDGNVRGWLDDREPEFPLLVVRYEDLERDAARELARIDRFLGLGCSDEALRAAAQRAAFDRLEALENAEARAGTPGLFAGVRAAKGDPGFRFMHRGASGGHRAALSEDQRARARARFAPLLARLYGDAAD